MASMQQQVENALKQLKGLTLSQRLAVLFGALLVGCSLVWMAQWAASSEMVALVEQTLSTEETAQISSGLTAMGEQHKLENGRVMVRAAANRPALWAQLGLMNKMPADTSIGFAEMVKEANPWLPQEENARRWTLAVQTALERMLKQVSGVKDARVLLNLNARDRGFSRNQPESKASVLLTTAGEPVSRQLALAAARLVSGAVRGLPLKNVEVVDGSGRSALEWDNESEESGSGLAQLQRQVERETQQKIEEQLRYDPHVRVSVQVVLERAAKVENASTPVEGVVTEEIKNDQATSRGKSGGQPGVEANTGAVAAGAEPEGESTTNNVTETRYQPGMTTTTTTNPAGSVKQVFAAIAVSHTYLESIFRKKNPDGKEPSEQDLAKVFEEQKTRIENQVAKLVMPPDAKQVAIDWYYDTPVAVAGSASSAAGMEVGMDLVARYGPASGLGLLALISLALVMRMAKSHSAGESFGVELGLPKEAIDAARRAASDLADVTVASRARAAASQGGAMVEPVASEGAPAPAIPVPMGTAAEGVLDAQEVDEGTVQIHKMIEQVSRMTSDDDDMMAHLVEKWVDQLPN
ncbi:MAG: hypothetical protein HZB38_01765 [Planctomycetes bacterium]|nr:hypothetical protein [Planctomycetota bacterium]